MNDASSDDDEPPTKGCLETTIFDDDSDDESTADFSDSDGDSEYLTDEEESVLVDTPTKAPKPKKKPVTRREKKPPLSRELAISIENVKFKIKNLRELNLLGFIVALKDFLDWKEIEACYNRRVFGTGKFDFMPPSKNAIRSAAYLKRLWTQNKKDQFGKVLLQRGAQFFRIVEAVNSRLPEGVPHGRYLDYPNPDGIFSCIHFLSFLDAFANCWS